MGVLSSISNLAIQFQTTRLMQAGRQTLYDLQAQVGSGKKTSDLSMLGASSTRELLAARAGQTKYDNYVSAINTVNTRLKVQATSLASMQDIAGQISTMINTQQSAQAASDASAAEQYKSFILQVQVMLNQKVENRFLFSGSRYSTEPVRDLKSLPVPPEEPYPFTPTTSPSLPIYDRDYTDQNTVSTITANNGASTLTLGTGTWEAQGYAVGDTVTLNGVRGIADGTTFTISALNNGVATVTPPPTSTGSIITQADATSIAADNSASTITLGSSTWAAQGIQVGDKITLSGTGTDGTYTVTALNNGIATVTPAPTTIAADTTFSVNTPFNMQRNAALSGPGAYYEDSVYIDDGLLNEYGVASTNPAFQNLIMGMRWAYAATQDPANYNAYMSKADELITTAKDQLRVIEADTAADQGLFTTKLKDHKQTLADLKDQESDVIDADVTDAATQLSILSAQIQASYAATGRVISLSIVNYL